MFTATRWRFSSILAALLALISFNTFAQVADYGEKRGQSDVSFGTNYYIGLPNCQRYPADVVAGGQSPYELWIASKVATTVTIQAEGVGYSTSVNVAPNQTKVVPIPEQVYNYQSEVARPHGVRVFAGDPITVTVATNWRSSGAVYKAIPVELWGTSYRTLNNFQDRDDYNHPGQILIMASQDNTKVQYKATARTEKGIGSVVLNKGEVFLILADTNDLYHHNSKGDLSGTYIESNKPIGVVTGHSKGAFPRFEETFHGVRTDMVRNAYVEMLLPVSASGMEFMSAPRKLTPNRKFTGAQEEGELIRFVATDDNTIIKQMRQDGSGLKQISVAMRAGEYFDIPSLTEPGYYVSNKPVVVGQYMKAWLQHTYQAKGGEGTLGHVMAGCGELTTLTPVPAWPSTAIFYSPTTNNNYVNVTFRTADVDKLKIDGKSFQTFFGPSIKEYAGTPYSYAVKEVSEGTHIIEGAPFGAYSYGHWDDPTGGFKNYAYAYPVSISAAVPCDDSIIMAGDPKCGVIEGLASVLPENSDCAGLLNIRLDATKSSNFILSFPEEFEIGVKQAKFVLRVADMSKPATAVIRAVSRSGKYVERTYTYAPEELTANPVLINFGVVGVGDTSRRTITLTNPSKTTPVVIKNLKLKFKNQEFILPIAQLPMTIPPTESRDLEIAATSLMVKANLIVDSLVAELSCRDVSLAELRVRSVKPQVYTGDADFGKVPVNSERKLDVLIRNMLNVDIVITGITWPDEAKPYFPRVEGLIEKFPITLKSGEEFPFKVVFTPGAEPNILRSTRAVLTCNTDEIKIYSDWQGMAVEAGPIINGFNWNERRVLDNFVPANIKSGGYTSRIEYGNSGSTALTDVALSISGPDGKYFTVPTDRLPGRLEANEFPRYLDVSFLPEWVVGTRDGERPYELTVTLTGNDNGVIKTASAKLQGIGQQPHTAMTPKIDFGSFAPGDKSVKNADITSNGSMALALLNTNGGFRIEGPDKDFFTIDQTFLDQLGAYPVSLTNNASNNNNVMSVPVIFNAKVARATPYNARLVIETDAPEAIYTDLIANVQEVGTPEGRPTDVKLHQFITLKANGQVSLANTGTLPLVVTAVSTPQGAAGVLWTRTVSATLPVTLNPGQKLDVDVVYSPLIFRADQNGAALEDNATITYTTNAGEYTSNLVGTPDEIVALVRIPREDYVISPGSMSDWIDFELNDRFAGIERLENLDRADISTFKATVNYNPTVAEPIPGVENVRAAGIATGWTILSAEITRPGEFAVTMKGNTPLRGAGSLFQFKMRGYLDTNKNTPLGTNLNILDNVKQGYVRIQNRPGKIILNLDCAANLRGVRFATTGYALAAAYPNPSAGNVSINFSTGLEGNAVIHLYNSMGQKVATLLEGTIAAGEYTLDVDLKKLNLPSGVYTYRLETARYSDTQQLIIAE
jgi:hypothetical protein